MVSFGLSIDASCRPFDRTSKRSRSARRPTMARIHDDHCSELWA
jgi:hypothetical protein